MKLSKLTLAMAISAFPLNAMADGYYAGIDGGATFAEGSRSVTDGISVHGDNSTFYNAGVFVGDELGNNIRGEMEFMYIGGDTDVKISDGTNTDKASVPVHGYVGTVNGYYDFKNSSSFIPYLGAGVGAIYAKTDSTRTAHFIGTGNNDTSFAYQLMAGVNVPVTDKVTVGVGYRLLGAPGNNIVNDVNSEVIGTVAYKFQ